MVISMTVMKSLMVMVTVNDSDDEDRKASTNDSVVISMIR